MLPEGGRAGVASRALPTLTAVSPGQLNQGEAAHDRDCGPVRWLRALTRSAGHVGSLGAQPLSRLVLEPDAGGGAEAPAALCRELVSN